MSNRMHRNRLLLAASALTLFAGAALAESARLGAEAEAEINAQGNGVHVDVGTDADATSGTIVIPRGQPADAGTAAPLGAPPLPGQALIDPVTQYPATLAEWTPDHLTGASVVNETGMRIATVDGVAADAAGTVHLILAIDAQPGALRAVPFERFSLGTSGGALLLVGATDAELVAMADASAGAYAPITTDAELQARLQTAAGN